jgi:urease accessory protein
MRSRALSCSGPKFGRDVDAHLAVDLAGGRTTLRRQRVGYPLHVTRGFYLDRMRPDLLTLYLQSASGGLYEGDRLQLDIAVANDAAFHLTTQAATVVHEGRDVGSRQRQTISVGPGAFCAITNDPYVLFPGADLRLETVATVAEDAVLLMADGFAVHDPGQSGRPFAQFASRQSVRRPDGRLLLQDFGRISGDAWTSGPQGTMTAAATVLVIAPPHKLSAAALIEEAADQCGCLAGASAAPNEAGQAMRMLASDGGALARGLEAVFHVVTHAALGVELARRRK